MKKLRSKRILSAAAALTVALGLVGCGDSGKSSDVAAPKSGGAKNGIAAPKSDAAEGGEVAEDAAAADGAADGLAEDFAAAVDGEFAEAEDGAFDGLDADAKTAADAETVVDDPAAVDNAIDEEPPAAGQLTAGEWNDNDNWGFFTNLVNSGTISFPSFGIDPTNRTAVTVKHSDGTPLANAKVVLRDGEGNALWSAVSDKNGRAYLFSEPGKAATVDVGVNGKGESFSVEEKTSGGGQDGEGSRSAGSTDLELVFDGEKITYADTQLMFIVDSTGSMGDEMLFLQSEFSAIAREIGTENTEYSVNFYRDEGDEYVTKCSGFTRDIGTLQTTLNSETADGGGDYPEAVAQILTETITDGEWREDAVKIAFLILDAPPHEGCEDKLMAAAKAAAEKGIRIVPVVSSNADRDTELFSRALAITSGGSYVFLTDDSGIGDSHLEPIIGEYEVEKLYDIIIRIVGDYRQ